MDASFNMKGEIHAFNTKNFFSHIIYVLLQFLEFALAYYTLVLGFPHL